MEPINYLTQVADPFSQAVQGVQLGAGMAELQQKQALIVQQQQQQQLAAQEQARFFAKPNPTMRDALQFASVLPKDRADALRPYIENFSKEQQQNVLKTNRQILSALQVNPETGIKLLKDYATAQRNSGDEEEAALYDRIAEAAADPTRGPAMAFKSLVTVTSGIPGAKEMFESIDKAAGTARAEALAPSALTKAVAEADKAVADARTAQATATNAPEKAAADAAKAAADAQKAQVDAKFAERVAIADLEKKGADLGLTKAQTGSALAMTSKLSAETKKIVLELEALRATGGVDPTKTFEKEEKLRKEFQARTKVYGELGTTFSNIESSANAKTGPGDIALITGFMKMLDPGSVVRETEFATARDTAGLYTRLENSLKKAESGQFLQPGQRQEFVSLAKQYLESANKKAGEDKKALGVVVKNYKLNPENVFGPETEAPAPASVTVGGKTFTRPPNFSDAQWNAYKQSEGIR
jgi:hypothetical protein